jgi:Caspase domain/Domain of unknown function (DUF4384)
VGWRRRDFLQRSTLAFAALGLSDPGLLLLTDRTQQALAQPTGRKLALLIGINQYPEQVSDRLPLRGSVLNGCLTDVELQRELLIHRYGFQPQDVLCLTDQQATRQAIVDAFLSHLTEQAQAGDVVVFHFSGLGSRVRLGDAEVQNALVPIDGILPTEDHPAINDLLEETLGLLLRSLRTEQVTTVLDVGYGDPGKALQGGLRIRSRPNRPTGQISEAERSLQEQLLNQIGINRSQWQRSPAFPGVVLAAAQPGQVAIEGQWSGFSAGVFTYALTQRLWAASSTTPLRIILGQTAAAIAQRVGTQQQPQLSGQKGGQSNGQKTQDATLAAYFLHPLSPAADGVITAVEADGKTAQVWLAGLSAPVLENYGANSLLSLGGSGAALSLRSRDGLRAIVRLPGSEADVPLVGQGVQEVLRAIPRDISLVIALDSSLERIERVDATSAFAAIPHVSAIVAGEQPADYWFGKLPTTAPALATSHLADLDLEASPPAKEQSPAIKSGYGLFHLGQATVPKTLAESDEAIKTAVRRLAPQLRSLLATKLLRLTENQGSSRLGVRATLEVVAPQARSLMQQETVRATWSSPPERRRLPATEEIPTLPLGSQIQYRLQNYSDRPVYFVLLGLDSSGRAIALYPAMAASPGSELAEPADDRVILPRATLTIPQTPVGSEWVLRGAAGLAETHLVFSAAPLTRTLEALAARIGSPDNMHRIDALSDPLEVAQAVLQDLHQTSTADRADKSDLASDAYWLDVNCWATLSFTYQVTEASVSA